MSDERHTVLCAWWLTPAQTLRAIVNNWLGLAPHLIPREVRHVSRFKRLAEHLQCVKKTVQLFLVDISRRLHPQRELLAQRGRQAYAVDIQEISSRQIAQVFLLAQHSDRIRGRLGKVMQFKPKHQ